MIEDWQEEEWETVGRTVNYRRLDDNNLQDIEDYHSELLDNYEEEEEDEEKEVDGINSNNIGY